MSETKLERRVLAANVLPDIVHKLAQYAGDVPPVALAVEAGLPSKIRIERVTTTPEGDCTVEFRRLGHFFTTSEVQ